MISLNMLCSDTFPTMPIKHLRRGCFVTHSKITICYPLIINAKHGYIENFHHTECMEQQRHKFYACQIHTLTKVLLHNREDLVNFDQVLGISSFHGEKSPNFSFKLLNFRGFYKFNRLKIKCLTA